MNARTHLSGLLFWCLAISTVALPCLLVAQAPAKRCGTHAEHLNYMGRMPGAATQFNKLLKLSRKHTIAQPQQVQAGQQGFNYTVPVAIHVIYHTDAQKIARAQIDRQLDILNEAFNGVAHQYAANTPPAFAPFRANVGVRFVLGKVRQEGKTKSAITYTRTDYDRLQLYDPDIKKTAAGGHDPFNPAEYLNIWVVNAPTSDALAFATLPGVNPTLDGIVVHNAYFGPTAHPDYNLGKTLVHEIGHYFFLFHTWGDRECGDDHVADTPPALKADFGTFPVDTFPFRAGVCSTGNLGEMWNNYMNTMDDENLTFFTKGQKSVILAALGPGGVRETIGSSKVWRLSNGLNKQCCPAIEGLQVVLKARNEVAVRWEANQNLKHFEVRHRPLWAGRWGPPKAVNKNRHTFTGLAPLTTYYFQVRAVCEGGKGAWRSVAALNTGQCAPPGTLTVQAEEQTATVLLGGSPTIDYKEVLLWQGWGTPRMMHQSAAVTGNSYSFTGLEPGRPYEIEVVWVCTNNSSRMDTIKTVFTTNGCSPPDAPAYINSQANAVEIISTMDAGLTYFGNHRKVGATAWGPEVESPLKDQILFSGLQSGTNYEFRVRAACHGAVPGQSDYVLFTAATLPVEVQNAEANNPAEVLLFPNPAIAGQKVVVQWQGGTTSGLNSTLVVCNNRGEVVYSANTGQLQPGTQVSLPTQGLAQGLYLIRLRHGANAVTRRMVIVSN